MTRQPWRLPPLAANRDVTDFKLSSSRDLVVYRSDQDVDGVFELFSVPVDGSLTPVKLSNPMVAGGDATAIFVLSPDGEHVVYRADELVDQRFDLLSVPVDGSQPATLLADDFAPGRPSDA